MSNYTSFPCPIGYFCVEGGEPELCPAGRMRDTVGAASKTDCPLCRPGYYCPNDTINTQGIPCRETFECPEGASIEKDCSPGRYCIGTTGYPPICPAGYYCPNATDSPNLCVRPYYCPEGSNMTRRCSLGYKAKDHVGIRYDESISCSICPEGTYGNATDRSICLTCPKGYYCPAGTGDGESYPCTAGYYCPLGSGYPRPCPAGMIGKVNRSESFSECIPCPANTFNDLEAQTYCRVCGSSANSFSNATACTCRGANRYHQHSTGSCVCYGDYIFYDETDEQQTDRDSDLDCQQPVDIRCGEKQARMASTRTCVYPEGYDCTGKCNNVGGSINVELGM